MVLKTSPCHWPAACHSSRIRANAPTPGANEPSDRYRYDPANPVPFITEPDFHQIGGPDDYQAIERRDDVLVYSTAPLIDPVTVCGLVRATIYASSSARDTGRSPGIVTGSRSMMSWTRTPSRRSETSSCATAPRAAWARKKPSTMNHRPPRPP